MTGLEVCVLVKDNVRVDSYFSNQNISQAIEPHLDNFFEEALLSKEKKDFNVQCNLTNSKPMKKL